MAKYSKLPGIHNLHYFIFTKHPVTNVVIAKVRKNCAIGSYKNATIHGINGRDIQECVIFMISSAMKKYQFLLNAAVLGLLTILH